MTTTFVVIAIGLGALVAALLYWLLIITEGTYLGTSVVVLLYDWTAGRYDRIKDLQYINELAFVALPIATSLYEVPKPRLLDVATGTGRVPLALLRGMTREITLVGADRSRGMLDEARTATEDTRDGEVIWVCADAMSLPFEDGSFDAVSCLEALEFVTDPRRALCEMIRVVKPGGVLWLSNRVGWEAHLFPGRLARRGRLEAALNELGLLDVETRRWQVHYDLVSARRPREL
jgi:ubiquinone/menaquinone biosynthesis C-methylase UbiE